MWYIILFFFYSLLERINKGKMGQKPENFKISKIFFESFTSFNNEETESIKC